MQTGKKPFKNLVPGRDLFYVPKYQRNYSWDEKQRRELWEDLLESLDKTHYIGTFLIEDSDESDDGLYDEVGIIDGQQRLTTLLILLFELQEQLHAHGKEEYAVDILDNYLVASDQQRLRLQEDDDAKFFKKYILEDVIDTEKSTQSSNPEAEYTLDTPSKRRLANTKSFFREKLEDAPPENTDYEDPVEFYTDLYSTIQNLDLLAYVVESRAEAARIFQTVNDRGKGLTDLEITKSYLMHRLALVTDDGPRDGEDDEEQRTEGLINIVQENFGEIYSNIEQITDTDVGSGLDEDQIQRYHFILWDANWTTSYDKRYYQNHLEHVKKAFATDNGDLPEEIIDYTNDLKRSFQRLRELVTLDGIDSTRIETRLENLYAVGRLGNFYPLLITAYDQYTRDLISESDFVRLLQKIETFIVRTYLIEQKAADTGRTRAYPLARQLYYNEPGKQADDISPSSVDDVIDKLADHVHNYCDDETLMDTLYDADVYSYYSDSNRKNELRYLLYAYELSLERERENIPFEVQKVVDNEDDRFTIEHVWPQTVSDEFPEHLHETINENSDRLGNLALMTIEDNAGNQNDPFEKKKAAFDESKFRMLNEIFENKEWNEATIDERERRILNVIQERWPDEVARRKEESPLSALGED
jgi:hypothetical protein